MNFEGFRKRRVAVIEGVEYVVTDAMFLVMKYFEESQSIQATDRHVISIFSAKTWLKLIQILEAIKYTFVQPPPFVLGRDPREYIGSILADFLQQMSPKELNQLYRAAHFLKIQKLKNCIAAFLSSKVFFELNEVDYFAIVKELEIKNELTIQKYKEYKQRFPFIN